MAKKYFLVLLLGFILLANGCWDRRELESLSLVEALGLDLGEDRKEVIVTTMIALPSQISGGPPGGGGGGGSQAASFAITMAAPTIYEAFNRINTSINREITLIQTTALIIGEDMAKQGVDHLMDTVIRFREMRRTMLFFVCRGKAADILKVHPKLEKNPSEYFNDLSRLNTRNGMFPRTTLNNFLETYEAYAQENYAPVLAKYKPMDSGESSQDKKKGEQEKKGDSKPDQKPEEAIRITGTAIFKKAKMVGTFDIYESQVLQLLTGNFREAALTISDPKQPDYNISFRLLATNPLGIKFISPAGGQGDKLQVNLKLEAEILSIQSGINYTSPKNEILLGKQIVKELKRRIQKVIYKAQKEYGSDVFGFGKTVRSTFLTSTAWDKYSWPERFPNAKISVNVKVALRRVGVQLHPPKLR